MLQSSWIACSRKSINYLCSDDNPKKMNAAQFSKTFKGTLSKLKPSTRGTINRGINSGIDEINSTVGSGEVMFDAIDFLKPEDKE